MKRTFFLIALISIQLTKLAIAGEGMWLPILLSQLNEKEMRAMGMRITADDIYSINHSSLKDAIVQFGGGCTAELISNQGLLLTNHHCGYGNIQRHSTLENDYLTDGFWAQSFAEELPNPGLSVTFLIRMEEVTSRVLAGVTANMNENERNTLIEKNANAVSDEAKKGTTYGAFVSSFYDGNQFYLFITETFNDIRLVGAPPSSIGKFGGDTDNWVWPRHTGDFSLFRIYANKDNQPAAYSKDNVPYKPKKCLTVSLKGVQEGDFTFVYGYPGSTQEYLSSYAVESIAMEHNPIAIALRQQRIDIMNNAMETDKLIRLQYSAKSFGIANYWKKMIGESRGVKRLHAVEKKQQFETEFRQWLEGNPDATKKYGDLLTAIKDAYASHDPVNNAYTYITEGLLGIELLRFSNGYNNLVKQCLDKGKTDEDISKLTKQLLGSARGFYKNFNSGIDRQLFESIMDSYLAMPDKEMRAPSVVETYCKYKCDAGKWAADLYTKTIFADSTTLFKFIGNFNRKDVRRIQKDPMFLLARGVYDYLFNQLAPKIDATFAVTDSLQRLYMAAQMEMQPDKRFYPDANSTMRITYGKVKGFLPADGVEYNWYTTLDGIVQKENPDIYDYKVDPKLKQLWQAKDYGRYAASDNSMHVAFIASNHTTGGNSGSPVLNADGELVGINFDRCWEGTMSDLIYDPDQCRNICLDIRYCLFIIDKFAGARRLIGEMNIAD